MHSESSTSAGPSQEDVFTVRIPRDEKGKFTMMKFGTGGAGLDFSKLGDTPVKIERENNLKEYKTANDLDLLPKYGAGSEYGRDQKEESRRKKYGIMLKRYNPDDQPWLLRVGQGKQAKRYKGVREGTIAQNTSYYIFTKAADGAFEAFPVDEWYNFNPIIRYKYLTSEEAEEEFNRRDVRLNYFNIMAKKRTKREEEGADLDDDEDGKGSKKSKKKKPTKDLILTDMEEWNDLGMSDDDNDNDDDEDNNDDEDKPKKKNKGKAAQKKSIKNSKKNSDDEAVEESDEGDYDDREVDYMSDSGDSSSLSGPEEEQDKDKKYDEKGVDQEAGLRNILDSDAEDEEEEEEEKEEDEIEEKDEKKEEKKKGDNDSSSSSSEDDSDIEKEASALFAKTEKKEKKETDSPPLKIEPTASTLDQSKDKVLKRKAEKTGEGKSPSAKKHKREDGEGITEDAIRRYLMRKPMTTLDLLQKFKSKKLNMSNETLTHVIAQLLKKINPEKKTINKKLYLSLKKPE